MGVDIMRKDKTKRDLYFIQLNLHKERHESLIEWIKAKADNNEQSLSAFCISILKEKFAEDEENGKETKKRSDL